MKKIALVLSGILVTVAVIWTILWNAGKGEVFARMDQEILALDAAGTRVHFAGRDVGGFPFGYEVTLKDVEIAVPTAGSIYRLPTVVTRADLSDPDRLVTKLPETFSLDIIPTEEMKVARAGLSDIYTIDFETIAAEVVIDGLPNAARTVTTSADSLLIAYGGADTDAKFAVEFQNLAGTSNLPAGIDGGNAVSNSQIGLIDYVVSGEAETGAAITLEGQVEDVLITGNTSLRSAADFQALMNGDVSGQIATTFSFGKSLGRFNSAGTDEIPAGTLTTSSGTSSGAIDLIDGSILVRGEARNNAWNVVTEAEGPVQDTTVKIEMLDAIYQVPLAPSDEMKPFEIKFAMVDLTLDDALWNLLDPETTADRSPAEILVDLVGSMRLTKSQSELRPGEAPPVAFGNLSINRLDLSALGASAQARGDVEFIQPVNMPNGAVTLRLKNVMKAMGDLVEVGILTPDILLVASLMAQNYLREDAETGELIGDFEMGPAGITVNGQPLQ